MTMPTQRRGFTLIELLVVIGIIVILAAILIPLVLRTSRNAGRMRTQADFQSIAIALEAYRTDFGDIPRVDLPDTGAAVLGKALLGKYGDGIKPNGAPDDTDPIVYQSNLPYDPGDCSRTSISAPSWVMLRPYGAGPANGEYWTQFDPTDGADGPGFRVGPRKIDVNADGVPDVAGGKVWGPYIDPAKFNTRGVFILDHQGGPILYFPTRPGATKLSDPDAYVARSKLSYINADDNLKLFRRLPDEAGSVTFPLWRMRIVFGDYNANGSIQGDQGEKAINQPYVLISAGADGLFGPAGYQPLNSPLSASQADEARRLVERDDDVTNVQ